MIKYIYGLLLTILFSCVNATENRILQIIPSHDDVSISYTSNDREEITLVFVHGWNCDSRYWRKQIPYFSNKYQVVALDLAGHGHSAIDRVTHTMESFAYDVKAVVDAVNADKVVLIGHSMGGHIIVRAARLMPKRVIGLIAVDTLQDVEAFFPEEQFKAILKSFQEDFKSNTEAFVRAEMIRPEDLDTMLTSWIVSDMAAEPKQVGISTLSEYLMQFVIGQIPPLFKEVKVPFFGINSDLEPTNIETNRKYIRHYDVTIMTEVGHFPMLERAREFNFIMEKAINRIISFK